MVVSNPRFIVRFRAGQCAPEADPASPGFACARFQALGFARETFFTDGHNIYLKLVELGPQKAQGIMQLMTGGQWTIVPVIQQLAEMIDFHQATGYASRWFPSGRDGLVVVDPLVSFGRPSVLSHGIATENVYDFYIAEQRLEQVSTWLGLKPTEVIAAVEFEQKMAA